MGLDSLSSGVSFFARGGVREVKCEKICVSELSQSRQHPGNTVKLTERYADKASDPEITVWTLLSHKTIMKFLLKCKSYRGFYYWPLEKCGLGRCLRPKGDAAFVLILHSRLRGMTSGQTPDCTDSCPKTEPLILCLQQQDVPSKPKLRGIIRETATFKVVDIRFRTFSTWTRRGGDIYLRQCGLHALPTFIPNRWINIKRRSWRKFVSLCKCCVAISSFHGWRPFSAKPRICCWQCWWMCVFFTFLMLNAPVRLVRHSTFFF